jgi:HNH endonuclease
MPRIDIPSPLRQLVEERAHASCEYCLLHQDDAATRHHIDHLIARKHGGPTESQNLAFACQLCNRYKGSDLAAIDPATQKVVPLFNPRTQIWGEHFELVGEHIRGLTEAGCATTQLLRLNDEARLIDRRALIEVRRYPFDRGGRDRYTRS